MALGHLLAPDLRLVGRACSLKGIVCNTAKVGHFMGSLQLPHYANLKLDRAGHIRKSPEKIKQLLDSPDSRYTLIHKYSGLLAPTNHPGGPQYKAVVLSKQDLASEYVDESAGVVFLGLDSDQHPFFAAPITDEGAKAVLSTTEKVSGEWVELRREGGPNLGQSDAALMAYAAGMVTWARKNLHSTVSGRHMKPLQGGHARSAEGERSIFPRIDPAVIMATTCGDWILLGRQAEWSRGRYSLLAGFCEVGETLEQAVVRESLEEAGIHVKPESVRYHSSQPWPFPQTLMIGFTSQAEQCVSIDKLSEEELGAIQKQGVRDEEVEDIFLKLPVAPHPDDNELESAYWFHRSFVRSSLKGRLAEGVQFAIPGPHALANIIISEWAHEKQQTQSWPGKDWPDVEIDYGRFKYILLRLSDANNNSKLVVRGDKTKEYHADILEVVQEQAKAAGLQVDVLGGGRIENGIQEIRVFGYSMAFGAAPHRLTASLLMRAYPMAKYSTSYAGY